MRNRIFKTGKVIFRNIYRIEVRREIEGFKEMLELKRDFAYKGKANPFLWGLVARKSARKSEGMRGIDR